MSRDVVEMVRFRYNTFARFTERHAPRRGNCPMKHRFKHVAMFVIIASAVVTAGCSEGKPSLSI